MEEELGATRRPPYKSLKYKECALNTIKLWKRSLVTLRSALAIQDSDQVPRTLAFALRYSSSVSAPESNRAFNFASSSASAMLV